MKNVFFELEILKTSKLIRKGERVVVGYAMTSDMDSDDTIIMPEAIESAKDDLLKYSTVLFNHDTERPIGKVVSSTVDDKGLLVKVVISKEEKEIWNKIKEGIINKFSIKGRATDFEEVDGRDGEKIKKIDKLELYEVSLVSVPANAEARTISWYVSKSLKNMSKTKENKKLQKKKPISKKSEMKDTSFGFADESITRPIFQINSCGEIDLENDGTFKKQVLKTGKWYHWDSEGGVLDITSEKIAQIVKNFKNKILDNVTIPLTHSKNPAMNTGEVIKLLQTDDGLDAICEIKDEKIIEKIKKGLITAISASIDPNYQNKESGKFVGPVLLHTALVHEPYIKGMQGFVQLSEEFKDRPILILEDEVITPFQNFQIIKELVERIAQKLEMLTEIDETKNMKKTTITLEIEIPKEFETDVEKSAYTTCVGKKLKEGMSFKEAAKFCAKNVKKDISEETTEETSEEETSKEETPKEEATEKETSEKEVTKEETSKKDVTKEETDKEESTKEESETEEKSEEESEKTAQEEKVELADAEGVFDKYLKAGKLVPAQKDAIISLLTSKSAIELGDKSVDVRTALINFLENQPKIIDFEEKGTETPPEETKVPKKDTKMPSEVKEFYTTKMELSEEDAEVAWQDAKDKTQAERKKSTIF